MDEDGNGNEDNNKGFGANDIGTDKKTFMKSKDEE